MRSSSYNTAGRRRLLLFLGDNPEKQYTVDELYSALCVQNLRVGKSSLYRLLDKLCAEGIVRKFKEEGKDSSLYQYLGSDAECAHHLHLKCLNCGRLIHLECHLGNELIAHIRAEHGFSVNSKKSVLWGVCESCAVEVGKGEKAL